MPVCKHQNRGPVKSYPDKLSRLTRFVWLLVGLAIHFWDFNSNCRVYSQLSFEGGVFHRATNTGIEGGNVDSGGAIFLFVRNNGSTPETFTNANITLNGSAASSFGSYDWSRVWPLTIEPGEMATLTLKGNASPFQEGNSINLGLHANFGASVSVPNFSLTTPKLRVGNVVPSQDRSKSYVYLRNDDAVSYSIDDLFLNENVTGQSRVVGGNTLIAPNSIKIIEVDHGSPQALLKPLAVRLAARRTDNNLAILTGAPVRLTEPNLPTGTWGSSLTNNEEVIEQARLQYGHSLSVSQGASAW